jgi:hypothetical protein
VATRIHLATGLALVATTVASCGIDKLADAIKDGQDSQDPPGRVSIALTDAPADSATRVVLEFSAVELTPDTGAPIVASINPPRAIDVLTLRGANKATLIQNQSVPAGRYTAIRFLVNTQGSSQGRSYVELSAGGHYPLVIPAGSETGLTLQQPFTVGEDGQVNLVADFDLRKSLIAPTSAGDFAFKPTVRLVDELATGTLAGTVAAGLDCDFIYVFGAAQTPRDINPVGGGPYVTTRAQTTADGVRSYRIGFLPAGDYKVALVCGQSDTPEGTEDLQFTAARTLRATIARNATTPLNFQ